MNSFAQQIDRVKRVTTPALLGRVIDVTGLTVMVSGLPAPVGAMCSIRLADGNKVGAQVVGFRDDQTVLMPLCDTLGVARGDEVGSLPGLARVGVCDALVGRVIDGMGRLIDGGPPVFYDTYYPLYCKAPKALARPRIKKAIATGIRVLDAMLTTGQGQRMGLFSGSGLGKSVLLGMIARYTEADVTVLALIGERGREVNEFIEKDLGSEGLGKTVLVVSTADESPVLRVRAGFVATAVAEYFRDRGKNVLLLMDSLTRLAVAQRQIGLAAGEPPATKGYTPSAFALLPRLLERAGQTEKGSVTGIYNVLVEADDLNDPVADTVRAVLDGHVWLSRKLSNRAHYPAISVTESVSRVMPDIVDQQHLTAWRTVLRAISTWDEIEDLVNIGAYAPGTNPVFDAVIQTRPAVLSFLQQDIAECVAFADAGEQLIALADRINEKIDRLTRGQERNNPDASAA
ncbi:MAG: FliI/YscN family ATPase [Planctomycetota bacterium]|nr:MAG: FliI/YscN family ATPase [Planctomycetota bacterium]